MTMCSRSCLMLLLIVILAELAFCRHMSRPTFAESDLDEDDRVLLRAAYDTPSYDHDDHYEDDDLDLGKVDLVKDGLWAIKAKIKELKAFDKALAAHALSTKLKLADLLKNHIKPIKQHHHYEAPYQTPSYQAQYPSQHQQYTVQQQHYPAQQQQYPAQQQQYPAQQQQYPAQQIGYDPYYGH